MTEISDVRDEPSGDGFSATFDGPARAISSALEVADRIPELGIEIRWACTPASERWSTAITA